MQNSPKISSTRRIEREGINAAQAFFEQNNCVFQEISLQNDFGKDAYLDVTREGAFGPLCVALQIKSGRSYRTNSGDYLIPLDSHANTWRNSTVPIFGIVYDPDDKILRWTDLTAYLRDNPQKNTGSVPIARSSALIENSIDKEFSEAIKKYSSASGSHIALSMLSDQPEQQISAVLDAWALGRSDVRYLLLLRRIISELSPEATRRAIWVLSHATSHPDIFWTPDNWIPEDIKNRIRASFRWSVEEISHAFMALDAEDTGRGTLAQSLHMILLEDSLLVEKMKQSVSQLLQAFKNENAIAALITMLASTDNPSEALEEMITKHPELLEDMLIRDLRLDLREHNYINLY
ncbi:DUF4365 domain-containing protein [Burkholderia gladioli]|uniref:DUF4365 domain-containing protein n=1 Tax=Burkholderia gladioli TaxID=28095 RepID=UPI001640B403|nr:DUF4365 domain-containing protein [Burkholderia gladioli]